MFNRFDQTIKSEVDSANTAHGLTGRDALDPNLVKAQLFEESQLGTSGTHLELPRCQIRSRRASTWVRSSTPRPWRC